MTLKLFVACGKCESIPTSLTGNAIFFVRVTTENWKEGWPAWPKTKRTVEALTLPDHLPTRGHVRHLKGIYSHSSRKTPEAAPSHTAPSNHPIPPLSSLNTANQIIKKKERGTVSPFDHRAPHDRIFCHVNTLTSDRFRLRVPVPLHLLNSPVAFRFADTISLGFLSPPLLILFFYFPHHVIMFRGCYSCCCCFDFVFFFELDNLIGFSTFQ